MKYAYSILLVTLLCSCTAHREGGEGEDSERLPFLDRANPLVQRTLAIMEQRARYSEIREIMRAEGQRVCEEDEHGTRWQEDCNTCSCERGQRACTNAVCPPSPAQLELQRTATLEFERIAREEAKQREELRERDRAAGRRVCEEGEHGGRWQEDCNTCFCSQGYRACTKNVCKKSSVQSKTEQAAREKVKP
jgi:hypothetical protein